MKSPATSRLLSLLCAAALAGACSSSGGGDNGTGGSSATGGSSTGGSPATGGSSSGGQMGTGGQVATGGTTGTGGVSGTGGVVATGGAAGGHSGGGSGGHAAGGGGGGAAGGHAGGGAAGHAAGGEAGSSASGGAAGGSATGGTGGASSSYNPCPTNGQPCKILPLGDSITFGINYEGSYRVELIKKAITANQNITYVGSQQNGPDTVPGTNVAFPKNHEGWSGYTISMILAKAANDAQSGANIILLHAGTNDTYMSDPTGAPARLSSAVDSLTTMFPNALIVVAKIIPYPSQMTNVNLINNSIPAMVQMKQAAGKHVIMADLNSGFNVSTMLSSDSIHPNMTGYDWMGDTWYSVVGSLFPAK